MSKLKLEVSLDDLEEMAHCIHGCSWVSGEEIYAYMKGCVTGVSDYDPQEWSVDGKGEVAINRDCILDNE